LGYWHIRGLANPIRLLLAYVKNSFTDVRYRRGSTPPYPCSEWPEDKEKFERDGTLLFPNIPYLFDQEAGIRLNQSSAILRYVAEKNNLTGPTIAIRAFNDMIMEEVQDFRETVVRLAYGPDYVKHRAIWESSLPHVLSRFAKLLDGKGEIFLSGLATPLTADFIAYEILHQTSLMDQTNALAKFPSVVAYIKRFEALPAIASFLQHPEYIHRPCNNVMAHFK